MGAHIVKNQRGTLKKHVMIRRMGSQGEERHPGKVGAGGEVEEMDKGHRESCMSQRRKSETWWRNSWREMWRHFMRVGFRGVVERGSVWGTRDQPTTSTGTRRILRHRRTFAHKRTFQHYPFVPRLVNVLLHLHTKSLLYRMLVPPNF